MWILLDKIVRSNILGQVTTSWTYSIISIATYVRHILKVSDKNIDHQTSKVTDQKTEKKVILHYKNGTYIRWKLVAYNCYARMDNIGLYGEKKNHFVTVLDLI